MKNLYAKLFAIQNLALAVSKDWTNPHFKNSYPTLDNTISVIIPEINKIWLLVTHFAEGDTFVTRVVDIESWEALDSKYTLLGTTPQQRGSEQTYFRRYSMIALFNLPSEDDDWNSASHWNSAPIRDDVPQIPTTTPKKEYTAPKGQKLFIEYINQIKTISDTNELNALADECKAIYKSEKQIAWIDKDIQARKDIIKNMIPHEQANGQW